jgi:hypothetical protein
MMRLARLSDNDFVALGKRVFDCCNAIMERHTKDSPDPWGWDWPTFGVLFDRKYRFWRKMLKEAERRGLMGKRFPVDDKRVHKRFKE